MKKQQAEEIFADAWELPPEERSAFVRSSCQGDAELENAVAQLLVAAAQAEDFFSGAGGENSAPLGLENLRAEGTGDWIGPFLLVRKLGEGACGVVWEARQETPIKRSVAVKIIKPGMDTAEVLARFASERQALARMEHPNIARVFDAGATQTGRSYFVMELVQGVPLTDFCDRNEFTLGERLNLFQEVCAAVNHAHQKGVIHRDLKPSNILVGGTKKQPYVKVIDFGIAKAAEGKLADATLLTRQEQLIGTPAYMSPEQAGADPQNLDTRSDVYSLGVLLYELIVGQTPFDTSRFKYLGNWEIRQAIRDSEPVRPSLRLTTLRGERLAEVAARRRTGIRHLTKATSHELDWIVMKAMEKSPDRRYPSVESFAADVNRYLQGEPVEARPPSWKYRSSKFIRRHARALAFVVLAFLVVISAATIAGVQALRAKSAEEMARQSLAEAVQARKESEQSLAQAVETRQALEEALADAEAVTEFMREVFQSPDPQTRGRDVRVVDALDSAAAGLPQRLGANPMRLALMQETLGETYKRLGLYKEAEELFRSALELRRQHQPPDDTSVLRARSNLARLHLGFYHFEDAIPLLKENLAAAKSSPDSRSESTDMKVKELARVLSANGQGQEALEILSGHAGELLEQLGPSNARTEDATSALEALKIHMGLSPPPERRPHTAENKKSAAENLLRLETTLEEARQRYEELVASNGEEAPETMEALQQLALASRSMGLDGVGYFEKYLAGIRQKYGDTHLETIRVEEQFIEFMLLSRGRNPATREEFIVQAEKTFGPRHPGILHQKSRWASDLHMAGKIEESLQIYEEIIPLMEEVMGKSSYGTHHAKAFQARSICSLGRVDEALEILRETSVRLFDDTYINSLYAHLLVWDGLEEEFNKSRLRVLRDTLDVWFNSPRRIDTLERSVWIACLLPFSNDDERQLSEELLQRADEARALPGLSPRKSWYWNEEIFVRALAALRFGEHGKIPQKLRQIEDLRSRDESHGFVLCATRLVKVLSLLQTGNVVDARNLYERAIRDFGYTPDETKHPLNGRSLACGTFLLVPILAREAIRELEKAGAD